MLPKMRIDGAIAELKVTADIVRRGYYPFAPVMDNTECDLVVDTGNHMFKVQIKSAHSDGDKMKVDLKRSSAKSRFYSKEDFDVLAVYDSTTTKIAYFNWKSIPNRRCMTIRFTDTAVKNGFVDKHRRLFFDDFTEFPIKYLLSEVGNHSTKEEAI